MLHRKLARFVSLGLPVGLFALIGTGTPNVAEACGGMFCDAGPTAMPVDQSGETIVFWIDDSGSEPFTEAHIQIQYEGDAEQFAWIIPVMAAPEVRVGSQALFDNLLQATVPTFQTTTTSIGDCSFGGGFGCGKFADLGAQGGRFEGAGEDGGDGGVDIVDRGFAGAFEYVTLTGDSVDEVIAWLEMAGYAQDDEAPPILAEYLDEGFLFVAVKLRSGADVDEIQPLSIRYPGVEPCIPIRLTRIAAVEDMAIRAMFLGAARVVPQNWPHVVLNHALLDYVNGPASSYSELVGAAIDEAGGRAFVTEYAGSDAAVSTAGVFDARWDAAAFADLPAVDVVDVLTAQGLFECGEGCFPTNAQVQVLLETFLPAPGGLTSEQFWSCLSCYEGQIDLGAWDSAAFALAFDERVVQPGQHAVDMLVDATYLTRLFTVLSPHEMTEDPLFHSNAGLPEVDNSIDVVQVNDCDGGPTVYEFGDGRSVAVDENFAMPQFDLPAAERIERIPATGPAQVEVDNTDEILAALASYNESRITGPAPSCSVRRVSPEGILTMLAVLGIAGFQRRRRT